MSSMNEYFLSVNKIITIHTLDEISFQDMQHLFEMLHSLQRLENKFDATLPSAGEGQFELCQRLTSASLVLAQTIKRLSCL